MHPDSAAGTFRRGPFSDGPCGRAGHPCSGAAPTSPPQRARAGRPVLRGDVLAVAVAGRAEIETWLRVRGPSGASGVPPWLTGVGRLLAVSLAPWSCWWLTRRRAECAGRGRGGWKPKWGPSRREGDRLGQGWAETGPGGACPRREGRTGGGDSTESASPSPSPYTQEPRLRRWWGSGGADWLYVAE